MLRETTSVEQSKLLTVRQAAQQLGVSRHTVRSWTYSGRISVVRVGPKAIRIPTEAIANIIAAGFKPAK
jgi:excisionase family DNA binding protein